MITDDCEGCGLRPAEWVTFKGYMLCGECHALMRRLKAYIPGVGR